MKTQILMALMVVASLFSSGARAEHDGRVLKVTSGGGLFVPPGNVDMRELTIYASGYTIQSTSRRVEENGTTKRITEETYGQIENKELLARAIAAAAKLSGGKLQKPSHDGCVDAGFESFSIYKSDKLVDFAERQNCILLLPQAKSERATAMKVVKYLEAELAKIPWTHDVAPNLK